MFRKLLANEGAPKSLCLFPDSGRNWFSYPLNTFEHTFDLKCQNQHFPPAIVIKTDKSVNKSTGLILILFTAAITTKVC